MDKHLQQSGAVQRRVEEHQQTLRAIQSSFVNYADFHKRNHFYRTWCVMSGLAEVKSRPDLRKMPACSSTLRMPKPFPNLTVSRCASSSTTISRFSSGPDLVDRFIWEINSDFAQDISFIVFLKIALKITDLDEVIEPDRVSSGRLRWRPLSRSCCHLRS